jgi:hypothetical protein
MAPHPTTTQPAKRKSWTTWLMLLLPYLALCFPQLYAHATPELLGFPFFYWYQFAWVVLTSLLLGIVYRRLKQPEIDSAANH